MIKDSQSTAISFKRMVGAKGQIGICLLTFVVAFFVAFSAFAADISVEATVTSNQLTLGNSAQLILSIQGTQKADPVSFPPIDGLEVRYVGPQTQVSIVNGNYSASKSFIYTIFPNKTGSFTIPPISITIDGKEFHTNPILMTVEDTPQVAPATNNENVAASLKDKIMLILGASVKDVYVGEQVPVTIKLMYTGVTISEIQYPSLDFDGFTKGEFAQPEQSQQVINGVGYNIVDFKTFVSPARVGELTLGPAKIDANLIYRSGGQGNPLGSNGGFGGDIFDTFFNSYEKRVLTATSQPVQFHVLPLPSEGKPDDFSGAVGRFDFNVTVSPVEVNVGDPITVRMKISGEGNLKAITFPSMNDPKLKMYDPQIKDDGNSKILEQVIIPSSDKVKELPAVKFSYFDIQEKKYKTIVQGPFEVTVKASKPGEEFKAVGFETTTPSIKVKEELGRDIVFIKERLGLLRPQGYHVYKTVWFWLVIIVYCAGWIACLVFYILRRKLSTDSRFARRFKAPQQARDGMQAAQAFMRSGNTKEFYGTVIKTLTDYLGNQLHIPSGGMTFLSIEPTLRAKKVDDQVVRSIKTIFEAADMVRFASIELDEGNMNKTFESLKVIIDHLERRL